MRLLSCLVIAIVAAFALPARPALAHPHVWIDLDTALVFDDRGRLTGLRVHWVFDEFYSLYMMEDLDTDGDGVAEADKLHGMAQSSTKNLAEYDYFTEVEMDGSRLAQGSVTEAEAAVQDGRLVLTFTVPFAEPVAIDGKSLTYAVYDPTYYIEILHVKEDPVSFEGAAPSDCRYVVLPPNPDAATVSFAASLDKTESGGDSLGDAFAERMTVLCGAPGE